MAQTTTLNLLSAQPHSGTDGESTTVTGTAVEAAGYYISGSNLQTFAWSFSNNFVADVLLEGTLETDPSDDDWFLIHQIDTTQFSGFTNFTGNFVLLRARVVDWTVGSVHFVSVSY
jgi:hypothetical protein